MSGFETETSRWAAVQSRDPFADGKFVYCVKTTGIYCRPICKARLARRSNITFRSNSNAAEADGFRPCMRCKPELERYSRQHEVISQACSTMQASATQGKEVPLKDLAAEARLTQSHFHRVFKSVMGVTPKLHSARLLGKDTVMAEGPGSRPDSLTPSLDQSSSASSDLWTFSVPHTPPAAAEWQGTGVLEASDPAVSMEYRSACLPSEIEFTIQPWRSGYVLISAANGRLLAMDVGDSYTDLVATMQRKFPFQGLLLSGWTKGTTTERSRTLPERLFTSVMEALDNPTGKILHLPTDVLKHLGSLSL